MARDPWKAGYETAACAAAELDPFPAITREHERLTRHLHARRQLRTKVASYTNEEYSQTWRKGFEAGKTVQRRLYGAQEQALVQAWYDGYDKGARLMANLRQQQMQPLRQRVWAPECLSDPTHLRRGGIRPCLPLPWATPVTRRLLPRVCPGTVR